MPHVPASTALARFRVLDLSRVRAGPTCVRQLADFGADVIKIETPPSIESETMGGPRHGPDFQNLHRNKRSITLNLKDKEGVTIFMKLVKTADVVVENYRPDVKDRLGIGYESLKKINPRIILASISGFGQDGPYRDRPGFDQIAQGMGGFMSITGLPGQGPVRAGTAIADISAGLFAALGILTALLEREKSGEGQWVQSSLLMSQIALLDFQAARYLMTGVPPGQAGNDHPTSMPTSAYKTKDGYMNIAATGEAMWRRVCEGLGRKDLLEREDFKGEQNRSKNRVALNSEIEKALAARTTAEWIGVMTAAEVPCGPIYSIDQMFDDPQVRHLGAAVSTKSAKLGEIRIVNQAVKLSRTPARIATAPPELGEHTAEVLAELGYGEAAVETLRRKQVV
ncbi:MAG: CoA transferase [Betaproteobacteria bacterium]|nr:MAG: CoA transferase [Betaproteobacteria bacterium]TMH93772.1 MAG: CoA transferase [Betaproteobacteria bacterium]